MKNKDIERIERRRNGGRDDNKTKKPISIFTGCLLTIIIMVLIGLLGGALETSNTPKYEIVDVINIKNHLFNYSKIYYKRSNQTNAYVLILIPDDLDVPKEFTYIKYNDSLKYYSLINTLKQFKYFSDYDLKEIKSWFENVRVFTENTNPNALKEEKNKINSEILALNKERKKNYISNMTRHLKNQSREMEKTMEELEKSNKLINEMMSKEYKLIE